MGKLSYLFPLILSLLLAACGESGKVKYDIKIPVNDPAKLSAEARAIYDALDAGKEISFDEISNALAKSHVTFYPKGSDKAGDVMALVDEARGSAPDADPHKRKVQYETWLTKKKGAATVYNVEANTLFHYLLDNKMQCYSGTVLNQLVNRKATDAKNFRNENWVAIFESGHILTGYLKQVGGKWNLFGIETTADGLAMVEYGPVDAITSELRIVDAEYWALTELFKFDLKDALTTGNAILEHTANRYGMGTRFKRLEGEQTALTKINSSPFSFGSADVAPGDRQRGKFDKRERRSIVGANPNPLIGNYTEIQVAESPSVMLSEIRVLIAEKGMVQLKMSTDGTFCTEYARTLYGGAQVCGFSGGLIWTLGGELEYRLEMLTGDALSELRTALRAVR